MNGFNKVILAGNLTRDPELRYTASGAAIAKGGIALNRKWKDGNGEAKDETTFIDWVSFGNTAALIAEHMVKGSAVLIDGRLHLEKWADKETQAQRQKLVVVAEHVTFLPTGQKEPEPKATEPKPKPEPGRQPVRQPAPPPRAKQPVPEEDDVPF